LSSAPRIALECVSRHYVTPAGPVRALDQVDLEVESGASVAIVGPSGCGKSTLLGLIGALELPSSGRVCLDGRDLARLPERERARLRRDELGLVLQADNLQPFLTALENVALTLALQGAEDGYERCRRALEDLGLDAEADKLPDQLSGGERQRVAVARALVHRPRLILADEPTGALDADASTGVVDLLLAARSELDATLLVVTHDPDVAARMDRTLAFRDGRLALRAAPADAG
jgi:putative ABC transport system ATP-binding protein